MNGNKWTLFTAIFQIIVGSLAILAFVYVCINGEEVTKWLITMPLAVIYVVIGTISIVQYRKQ